MPKQDEEPRQTPVDKIEAREGAPDARDTAAASYDEALAKGYIGEHPNPEDRDNTRHTVAGVIDQANKAKAEDAKAEKAK